MVKTRIRLLREARGMTRKELGDRIGRVAKTIQRLEDGDTPLKPDMAQKIATVFEVEPLDLYAFTDQNDPELQEIVALYNGLTDHDRKAVVALLRALSRAEGGG